MVDWQYKKINELGLLERGRSRHRPRNDASLYGGDYPFIQTGDVRLAQFYVTKYSQTYNEKGLAQSRLWQPGTLCITIAANIAESAILKIPACFPDSIVGFVADEKKSDVRYVKYSIDNIKRKMQKVAGGAAQDNLSLEKISLFKIATPAVNKQIEIANLLSRYDESIENNNCRIEILEEMTQVIYKEWFVEKKSKKWKTEKLIKYVDFVRGVEPGSNNYEGSMGHGLVPFLRVGDLGSRNSELFVKEKLAKGKILQEDDIVVSLDGTVGIVKIGMEGCYSTGMRKLKILDNSISRVFLYCLMKSEDIQSVIKANAKGTTIMHAGSAVNKMEFTLPTQDEMDRFSEITEPMLKEILILNKKNKNLISTRDLLLPKLMSGEIEL